MFNPRMCIKAVIGLVLIVCGSLVIAEEAGLKGYKTVAEAQKFKLEKSSIDGSRKNPGKLGFRFDWDKESGAVVVEVEKDSPAEKAGLNKGDVLSKLGGNKIPDLETLRLFLIGIREGDNVKVVVKRETNFKEFDLQAAPWSNPLVNQAKVKLGIFFTPNKNQSKLEVKSLSPNGPAEKAGVKVGDTLIAIDGKKVTPVTGVSSILEGKKENEVVRVVVSRNGKVFNLEARLESDVADEGGKSWNDLDRKLFKKPVYDYYTEQSDGGCKVEGKIFGAVTVEKKRMEYASGSPRTAILDHALTLVLARDGEKSLEGFDGVFFLYAGSRAAITRGNILWPHKGFYSHKGKRITYFICPEGGERMFSISVIAHEFGHMLGLPDLYARPEVPDMEGLGRWCSMSNGEGLEGRPVHFSAWCKEQMGWTVPTIIDPRVQQKLILSPIEGKNSECIKIPVRPDGAEYFLLENRVRKGFDQNLPGEGLLIWRVVDGKPNLEESHGIAGPAGPSRFPESVPYPSKSNRNFTPSTTPSSTPVKQGGWPLHITNIQRLPDGRVAFQIGYEFY
ncbi:MAG: M6 family metalloprotease domain-containing protein [Planctomycetes bacterium]|nr:M6 family metalloprotease domain-containing protein [Planctomycetota bacterium]